MKGIDKVLHNLDHATQNSGKGYAYEIARTAAEYRKPGSTITEMNRIIQPFTYKNADDEVVLNGVYDIDAFQVIGNWRILNEFKDRKYLYATKDIKNQILKMETALAMDIADEARIWVKDGSAVSNPLKQYAKDRGIKIFDDNEQLLNP